MRTAVTNNPVETPCNGTSSQQRVQILVSSQLDDEFEEIYGCKKKCLYILIIFTVVTVLLNMAFTVWIIKVLDLNASGLGSLMIGQTGIKVTSETEILDALEAGVVTVPDGRNLHIESAGNITIASTNEFSRATNGIFLGQSHFQSFGKHLMVRNPAGDILFRVDPREVLVAAEDVTISNSGGLKLDGSIETTLIRGAIATDFRLESPTRTVHISGDEQVMAESRAGGVKGQCLDDIKLQGGNRVILDSQRLLMRNLKTSWPFVRTSTRGRVHQVCVCENGRLFLAPANGICQIHRRHCDEPIAFENII